MWHNASDGCNYDWVDKMPALFEECGLEVVKSQKIGMKDRHRLPWIHNKLLGLRDMLISPLIKGTPKEEDYSKFVYGLLTESYQGVALYIIPVRGRKKDNAV